MRKITFILALALLLGACTDSTEDIEIGSILILTGEGAAWGNAARNGIDMAVAEINANNGINGKKLKVKHQDDQSSAKHALSAFRKLTDFDDIHIIIGTTWSHTGVPLVEKANQKKILMISPSLGVKEFNENSKYLFNTWPHDFILSEKLADYVFEKGHRKIVLISAQNIWVKDQTNAFTKRFKELGGSIELLIEPDVSDMNLNPEALKVKEAAKGVTAIVSTTDGVLVGVRTAKKIRELGIDLPIYSITIDADTIEASEGAYEGMHFLTFLTPTDEFEQKYRNSFGKEPDIGSASAYDAAMMLAKAMRETGSTDTEILQEYMNDMATWNGASGNLVSDGKGAFAKPHLVKEIKDGIAVTIFNSNSQQ